MTAVVIFAGPTLTHDEIRAELPGAQIHPPVAQGDVLRVALTGSAQVLGIVDGYFERVPAVTHKEILWAMSRGIHVFGAASMGALRAAELAAFGMEGVGEIYEAFANGMLDADDEVAVLHAPAEHGFIAASEALVNVRATFAAAQEDEAASPEVTARAIEIAKHLFFPDRTYARVFRDLSSSATAAEVERCAAFVKQHRVDQKKEDARAMLRLIAERIAGLAPKKVSYAFEPSTYFELLRAEVESDLVATREGIDAANLATEIALDPNLYDRVLGLAARLVAAERERDAAGVSFSDASATNAALESFRRARGLLSVEAMADHMSRERVVAHAWSDLAQLDATLRWSFERSRAATMARFADALRLAGSYGMTIERIEQKSAALAELGIGTATLSDTKISEGELFTWYFQGRMHTDVPADVGAYASARGFGDRDSFVLALAREYVFVERAGTR